MKERRAPIYLDHQNVAIVTVYTHYADCLDFCLSDFVIYQGKNHYEMAKEGAKELMHHISEDVNTLFLMALKEEVDAEIERRKK